MSLKSIQRQVNKFLKSDRGKAQIHKMIAGRAENAAKDFKAILMQNVLSSNFTGSEQSVVDHMQNMWADKPKTIGDYCEVDMFFAGDLSRRSLDPDHYNDVENIVALFNNGYVASDYVYGEWNSSYPTPDADEEMGTVRHGLVRSRIYRPAKYFMQHAVSEFNAKYAKYGIMADIADIYKESETWVNRGIGGDLSFEPSRISSNGVKRER